MLHVDPEHYIHVVESGWHGFAERRQRPRRRKLVHAHWRAPGGVLGAAAEARRAVSDQSVGVPPTNLGGIGCRSTPTDNGG